MIESDRTAILACSCKHAFQDERYGVGQRLHNPTKKDGGSVKRCTVCGAERTRSGGKASK